MAMVSPRHYRAMGREHTIDGYKRSLTNVDPGLVYSLRQFIHRIELVAAVVKALESQCLEYFRAPYDTYLFHSRGCW